MIKSYPPNVYDSVVSVSHTGDVIWQTALNISGKGKAELHFCHNFTGKGEYKVTIDGTVLINGVIGIIVSDQDYRFTVEWNKSLLIEYRVNDAGQTCYVDIAYYNR